MVIALIACVVASARAQQTGTPAPSAAAFARAVQLHDSGKYADAVPLFRQAITLGFQPTNQARFRLARALARSGDVDSALVELETLATAGFSNTSVLSMPDLDGLRALPRFKDFETRVNANARPCAADPRFHAFDFWIGEWDVQPTGATRGPVGAGATSIIEAQLDGCVIQENWIPIGGVGSGKSFNVFNTVTRQWEQYYVDTRGSITHYKGTFQPDGSLLYEADQFASSNKLRMTFFNQGPNQVRQFGQISTDGGKTWSPSFDLTYIRKTSRQ
jgi:hypothetical protein